MGVEAATVQRILRHSSISVTTGTYVDVIEPPHNRRQACSVIHFVVKRCKAAICSTTWRPM
jgi:hypothetical protein